MATIQNYKSGRIQTQIKLIFSVFALAEGLSVKKNEKIFHSRGLNHEI